MAIQKMSGRERTRTPQEDLAERRDGRVDLDPAIDNPHEEDGGDQPRDDAGHEELADRLLREDAHDDEDDARRDDAAETAHGGDDARREPFIVTVPVHLRDGDTGEGRRRGRRGAADRLEARRSEDRRHGQPARDMADELVGRIVRSATAIPELKPICPISTKSGKTV